MYRFRRIENLIGKYKELENQEIYFSDIVSLNDPMEGFREFYWSGDVIAWKNLFKHYILCLEQMCFLAYLSDEMQIFSARDIPIFIEEDKLPTEQYRQMFREIWEKFFQIDGIKEYIAIIASLPWKVYRDEIYAYFKYIHFIAFQVIMETYIKHGFQESYTTQPPDYSSHLKGFVEALKKINLVDEDEQDKIKILVKIQRDLLLEFDLISAYKLYDSPINQRRWFILSEFTNAYLDSLIKLTYPEAYVACFMSDCTNAAVWGHYGDSHKGVCLKFRTKDTNGIPSIDLNCIIGMGEKPIYDYRQFPFHKIDYTNKFKEIDFFKSIGRLTMGQLMRQWYTDQEGNRSSCADHMIDKKREEIWRDQYWNSYNSGFLIKLKDWEYEKEHRLLLSSVLDSFEEVEDRKLKYKFDDLEAIIFGTRTSIEDKIKIIKIIESKCKVNHRKNFDFYQAEYSQTTGRMGIRKLDFIKLDLT